MKARVLGALQARGTRRIRHLLSDRNVALSEVPRGRSLAELCSEESFDLVLLDERRLAGRRATSISAIRELPDHPEVIVFVREEDPEVRARLLAEGAIAVVNDGLSDESLRDALLALIHRRRDEIVRRFAAESSEGSARLGDFASSSPAMQEFMSLVRRVLDVDSSLLILGETGVGKEHLARAIHAEGGSKGPFVVVNCAAIPEALLESELFGHVAGAFTGASRSHRGSFELADGGTAFLDEIGELPLHLQAKLLRVLQDKAIQPVGGESTLDVDVRVMAASNRNLSAEIAAGRFRSDLYYRIAVVTLTVPPLRERREDVPALIESYVSQFRTRFKRPATRVREDALQVLVEYAWPGNVRELINVIERAVLLSTGEEITPADLPVDLVGWREPGAAEGPSGAAPVAAPLLEAPWHEAREAVMASFERRYLTELLRATSGRIGDAARRAEVSPRFLYEKMRKLGLRKESFKHAPAAALKEVAAEAGGSPAGRRTRRAR